MAPDVEELIKRVNTLTLDKNRLKQKLSQLTNNGNNHRSSGLDTSDLLKQLSSSFDSPILDPVNIATPAADVNSSSSPKGSSSSDVATTTTTTTNNNNSRDHLAASLIAGVQCTTSCEDDLLYINNLFKFRLEEYQENWDLIQSKCTALLSELNALQKHYSILKREKLELEERLKRKSDEHDKVTSELQTVVLNYELQLSAMSEHLSMITSQVNLADSNT